jgi:hypothetical protein
MFVKVKVIDSNGMEKGRAYTYESDIDLSIGERVIADMGGSDKVLSVVDFAKPEDYENVDFEIKKIKSIYLGEADSDGVLPEKTIDILIEKETLPVIKINFEDLKSELTETLQKYNNIVVTEQSLSGCKSTQKELAGLRIKIDNYRKDKKKELSAPIVAFEEQCKELVALIEKAEQPIKDGIRVFDDKKKDAKRELALKVIAKVIREMGLFAKYAQRLDVSERYCNLTATELDIRNDVEARAMALKVEQDRELELIEIIKATIDSENENIKSKMSLADFQRVMDMGMPTTQVIAEIKTRAQKIYAAENIKEEPKEEPKQEVIETKEEPKEPIVEQKYFAIYKVTGTERELLSLSAHLKSEMLSYSVVEQGEI